MSIDLQQIFQSCSRAKQNLLRSLQLGNYSKSVPEAPSSELRPAERPCYSLEQHELLRILITPVFLRNQFPRLHSAERPPKAPIPGFQIDENTRLSRGGTQNLPYRLKFAQAAFPPGNRHRTSSLSRWLDSKRLHIWLFPNALKFQEFRFLPACLFLRSRKPLCRERSRGKSGLEFCAPPDSGDCLNHTARY